MPLPRRHLLLAARLLLLLLLGVGLPVACGEADAPDAPRDPVRTVKVETVEPAAALRSRSFVGRIGAVRTVELSFQVSGRLAELPVLEGQVVPKGGLLAALDTEDLRLALREAEVQRDLAERTLQRHRSLAPGTVARTVLDEAEAAFRLREVALEQAQRNLDYATLEAPFDALVTRRLVEPPTVIASGTPVLRVQDVTELRVTFSVPEDLMALVGRDDVLVVEAALPSRPELRFPLTYREHQTEPNAVAQTYEVSFGMPHPAGITVLPGMTAVVYASFTGGAAAAQELRVPLTAVVTGEEPHVWVLDADAEAVRRQPVALGPVVGDRVTVLEGLEPGQRVVVAGASLLREGMRVRPMDGF